MSTRSKPIKGRPQANTWGSSQLEKVETTSDGDFPSLPDIQTLRESLAQRAGNFTTYPDSTDPKSDGGTSIREVGTIDPKQKPEGSFSVPPQQLADLSNQRNGDYTTSDYLPRNTDQPVDDIGKLSNLFRMKNEASGNNPNLQTPEEKPLSPAEVKAQQQLEYTKLRDERAVRDAQLIDALLQQFQQMYASAPHAATEDMIREQLKDVTEQSYRKRSPKELFVAACTGAIARIEARIKTLTYEVRSAQSWSQTMQGKGNQRRSPFVKAGKKATGAEIRTTMLKGQEGPNQTIASN